MNSLSLKYQKITKPRNFLDFSRKSSISLCRVFYQRKNRFPYPFIYLRLEKGTPFEMLRAEPPLLGHYREYPLPRSPEAWIWMVQVFRVSLAIQASYSGQKRSPRLPIEHLIFKGINAVRDDEFLETILSFVYSRRYWSIKHSNDSPSGLWPHSEQWYSIVSTINW